MLIKYKCSNCGKECEKPHYRVKGKTHKYCTRSCRYTHMKVTMKNNKFWDHPVCQSNQFRSGHRPLANFKRSNASRDSRIDRIWKKAIKELDFHRCQKCGYEGNNSNTNLVAHHIESFHKKPKLRFDLSNGITLCRKCHRETHLKELSTATQY